MRKKSLFFAGLIVFVIGVGLPMLKAQAAPSVITYKSGFQVQNLGGVTATVSIQFFDRGTGNSVYTFADTIGPGLSKTYYPIGTTPPMPGFPGTFESFASGARPGCGAFRRRACVRRLRQVHPSARQLAGWCGRS